MYFSICKEDSQGVLINNIELLEMSLCLIKYKKHLEDIPTATVH